MRKFIILHPSTDKKTVHKSFLLTETVARHLAESAKQNQVSENELINMILAYFFCED